MTRSAVLLLACLGISFGIGSPSVAGPISFQATLSVDILDNLFVIASDATGGAYYAPDVGILELNPRVFVVEDVGGPFGPETPRDIIPPIVAGALNNYANGNARFSPRTDGSFGGPMAILGAFDFLSAGGAVLMSIVLDPIGVGGTATTSALGGAISTLTTGMEWETGTVTANDVIAGGVPGQSISRTGFDHRNAEGLGHLRLVTASEMTIDGSAAGFFIRVPTFATLDLHFVPESGALLLLVLGGLALARSGLGTIRK